MFTFVLVHRVEIEATGKFFGPCKKGRILGILYLKRYFGFSAINFKGILDPIIKMGVFKFLERSKNRVTKAPYRLVLRFV